MHKDERVSTPFPCPHCGTTLTPPVAACPACGIRLLGPQAARLWQVNQQLTALRSEADRLMADLLRPVGPVDHGQAGAPGAPVGSVPGAASSPGAPAGWTPYPDAPMPAAPAPRRSLTGQQMLLGLGALLLLSGVSFFLAVVWFVVGLVGQAIIMVLLTAAAVASSAWATVRRLPAAAETAAVIATGLLALDLWAAHRLNLAGLGEVPGDVYWSVAGLLGAGLLLGFDRLMPRTAEGQPLRPILVYRPAATTMLAISGWSLFGVLDPGLLGSCAVALGLAVLSVVGVLVAKRIDRRQGPGAFPLSALPLLISALAATATYLLTGLALGYASDSSTAERYAAFGLLLLGPVLSFLAPSLANRRVAGQHVAEAPVDPEPAAAGPATGAPGRLTWLPVLGVIGLVPVLGIPLMDAPWWVLLVLAVVLAVVLSLDWLIARPLLRPAPWVDALAVVTWAAQPVLVLLVLVLAESGADSGQTLLAGAQDGVDRAWWWPVVPGVAWFASSTVAAIRERSAWWAVVAQVAALVTVFAAVRDAEEIVWVVAGLVACAASFALAGYARSLPSTEQGLDAAEILDVSALVFAALYGAAAIASSLEESPWLEAAAFIAVGVLTLAYSGARDRLPLAYAGSALVTAGIGVLLNEADVNEIEAFTAPLVVLLGVIGWVQWRRDATAPTMLTMAPSLSAALLPSTWVAVADGGALRLLAVTALGVVALVVGLSRHWKAPVTVGTLVLAVVAITQGGPLIEYVPGWITLIGGGAVLLAVGVAWEQAIAAGRRTAAWYGALR